MVEAACTTKRYYTLAGITVAVRDSAGSGSLNYLLGDQLGSTTVSVNASGGTPVVQRYLPYGAPRSTTGGTTVTDRGWIGQTKDATTGLQYLNARYYDPTIGRFTATDPVADLNSPGTLDAYGYAGGSPVSAKDPSGLFGLPVYEEMQNIANRPWQIYQERKREGYYDRPEPRGFFAGFLNGFVALPIAALGVATDATNCGRGAGCSFEHSRNMQHGIAHTITNPTSIVRSCNADRTTCAGEMLGGLAFGGAAKRLLGPSGAAEATSATRAADAAGVITRSLDDVSTLKGATLGEVDALIPGGWVKSPTTGTGGVRYSNPERLGEQVRVMPGNPADPNPLKQGPYVRISRNGSVTDPIPLDGNPQAG